MKDSVATSEAIMEQQTALAQLITSIHFTEKPELETRYGKSGKEKTLQDALYHLSYLTEAIRAKSEAIFISYIEWIRIVLEARNVPVEILIDNLIYVEKACAQLLSAETLEVIKPYLEKGIQHLNSVKTFPPSFLREDNPLHTNASQYLSFLLEGKRKEAKEIIDDLLRKKHSIISIYENVFKVTQYEIGLLWQTNKITVAHEHYCTAATQVIMANIYPLVFETRKKGLNMVACSISGDLHEIGIRMLSDLFELDGWNTYYLGSNMPDVNILTALKEQDADILALSVTIPFHLSKAEILINKIRKDAALDKLKILVGGYTLNTVPDLWKQLGADGYAHNAQDALMLANQLQPKFSHDR